MRVGQGGWGGVGTRTGPWLGSSVFASTRGCRSEVAWCLVVFRR